MNQHTYTQQPGSANYQPQQYNPYLPEQPPPYPAGPTGAYYNPQQQPQIVYVERAPPVRSNQSDWWLTSLLALCCGCFLGEVCCDHPCLCCVLPCPIRFPSFR